MIHSRENAWEFIQSFYKQYGIVPGSGFLAGYYKVSMESIRNLLNNLESDGRIKRLKKGGDGKYFTEYEIVNNSNKN